MLDIILFILKIIGILLLCIIGIILIILLLILFIPLRYQISVSYHERWNIKVSFHWLLYFINGKFIYPGKEALQIKVGFLKIFDLNKWKEKSESSDFNKKTKHKKSKNKKVKKQEEEKQVSAACNTTTSTANISRKKDIDDTNDKADRKNKTVTKPSLWKRITFQFKKIYDKIISIINRIQNIIKNIRYYLELLNDPRFAGAFILGKDSILKVFLHMIPKKMTGTISFGFDDPSTTGYMMALYGAFYPLFGTDVKVEPDFERQFFDMELKTSGKITSFRMIFTFLYLFFSKEIRYFIRMLKQENKVS